VICLLHASRCGNRLKELEFHKRSDADRFFIGVPGMAR
jgi:hypothetical protein